MSAPGRARRSRSLRWQPTRTRHFYDLADGANATDRFVLRIGVPQHASEEAIAEAGLTSIAPNPSAGGARVLFALPEAGTVRLTVLDVRGRKVATLAAR